MTRKTIRPESIALLREIDSLIQQADGQPITVAGLLTLAAGPTGSLATDTMPHRTMMRRIQALEHGKNITLERGYASNMALDPAASYISISRKGIAIARPQPAPAPGIVATAPTWRGECLRAPVQSVSLDTLHRPPVMRPGSQDFRAHASRGM